MLKIPQSLMPMLCRYKSIRPPNSHVDAFELNGTAELVAQLEAEKNALLAKLDAMTNALECIRFYALDNVPEQLRETAKQALEFSAQPEGGEK